MNVALDEPPGTVIDEGTVKPVLVENTATLSAVAAGAVRVMVQVPLLPGASDIGEQLSWDSAAANGERAMGKDIDACPIWARTSAPCPALIAPALAVKFAELEPAGTVTEAGTERLAGILLEVETWVPPAGAGWLIWTVQTVFVLAVRVEAAHVSEEGAIAGLASERATVMLLLPRETVTEPV